MSDDLRDVKSPYNGKVIGQVPVCTRADVDRAVRTASSALSAPMPAWQRAEILDTAARLLRERVDAFAATIAGEAAKPLKSARVEAERAVSTFTFAAVEARRLTGEMIPMDAADVGEGKIAFTIRVPVGVIGAISPFNFPLNLVAHKVAPAIAAGCPVVLKPAGQTPLSAVALADLLLNDCGLPPEWLHVVTGSGAEVGDAIVTHADIAYISFTGSAEVGWGIAAKAPKKRVRLELGNSTPVIIEPDGDWATAAQKISVGGFSHAGQSCISTQRVYVHADIAEDFSVALVERVEALKVGDPMDPDTDVSQLISTGDRDRVKAWIDEAWQAGARVLAGGNVVDGILRPTVLADVRPDMRVVRDEVFGPVVAMQTYTTLDEAITLADDTRYGLQAGIFTARIDSALEAAKRLHFGGITVNEIPTWRADHMPYGGVRESGNTKEGPAWAVREMTEERLVVIQP